MSDQFSLFDIPKQPAAQEIEPLAVEVSDAPKIGEQPATKQTKGKQAKQPKQSKTTLNPTAMYDAIVAHLMENPIPPFTEFKCKSLHPHAFKWLIDTLVTSTKPHAFTDRLVVMIQVEKPSQAPSNPEGRYLQFEELHRRTLQASLCPKAIGQKPKKIRAANGKRSNKIVVHKA